MKMLLLLLFFPVVSFAQCYKYTRVVVSSKGCDNFSFDKEVVHNVEGKILIDSNYVIIDNKQFLLKSNNGFSGIKKYTIVFVYYNKAFAGIRLHRQNTNYTYYVLK